MSLPAVIQIPGALAACVLVTDSHRGSWASQVVSSPGLFVADAQGLVGILNAVGGLPESLRG